MRLFEPITKNKQSEINSPIFFPMWFLLLVNVKSIEFILHYLQ